MVSNSNQAGCEPQPRRLAKLLLDWYGRHARRLPWRDQPEPYRVWVSEIMLQQTRVETVRPYFERWMELFPTVKALANASEQEVLHAWEGLGYYSRARNLHRAARQVVEEYDGQIPAERELLEKLPGVGRYTAGAIASIAFGKDEAALDGNIRRVLARVFNVSLPVRSREGEKHLWLLAERELPPGKAGDFNQAVMDLASSICVPRAPACLICPIQACCEAFELGKQEELPVQKPKAAIPHYTVTAAVIHRDGLVLIARRPANGLLGGMWEFPGGKVEPGEELSQALKREIREELAAEIQVNGEIGIFQHGYTHFKVTLHAFHCRLAKNEPEALEASEIRWVSPGQLADYPMGKIDRMIAHQLIKEQER